MIKTLSVVIFVIWTSLLPAYAYIDPGSGSAIMSAIIGAFVAIGILVKTFWYKIKSFLGLSKSKEEPKNKTQKQNKSSK